MTTVRRGAELAREGEVAGDGVGVGVLFCETDCCGLA